MPKKPKPRQIGTDARPWAGGKRPDLAVRDKNGRIIRWKGGKSQHGISRQRKLEDAKKELDGASTRSRYANDERGGKFYFKKDGKWKGVSRRDLHKTIHQIEAEKRGKKPKPKSRQKRG